MAAIDPKAINEAGYKDDIHLTGVSAKKKIYDTTKSRETLTNEVIKKLDSDSLEVSNTEFDDSWLSDVEKNVIDCDLAPPTFSEFINMHNSLERVTETDRKSVV
eukprot:TRINITY_DN19507_c0_g1_i2.p1 TRINITY_DN19507_c0_g1~~TRINITY_DN19507_c0_g1_i2.p1  ORF type:complete len:104 (+),score=23.95 TRINITY_DN19507_c0_g1_i2:66-377(+)